MYILSTPYVITEVDFKTSQKYFRYNFSSSKTMLTFVHLNLTRISMKSTTTSTTSYKSLKRAIATFVLPLALSCALAVPSASYAAPDVSNLPDSSFSKLCFILTGIAYDFAQVKGDTLAVQKYNKTMSAVETDVVLRGSIDDLFYYALSKRGVYKGEALKSLLQLQCPDTFRSNVLSNRQEPV